VLPGFDVSKRNRKFETGLIIAVSINIKGIERENDM